MTDFLASIFYAGLADTFANEVKYLFEDMGIAAAICLAVGLLFIIIEIFNPGFGFFGITGIILMVVGMILCATNNGRGNPLLQILLLILFTGIICVLAFVAMAYSAKKGWLSRTPFVMKENAVSTGITDGTADYTSLVGKTGKAVSMLRPSGIAEIEGERYDVVAKGEFITADSKICVEEVEGVRIVVKEVKEINE